MSSDNVTPFRRPPPKRPVAPQQSGGWGFKTHRGKAVLVHVLALACFALPYLIGGGQLMRFVGLGLGIAAAVIAYTSRGEAMPWAATHHEQAIRTLLIAFAIMTVLTLPSLVIPRDSITVMSWYLPVYFWGNVIVAIWAGLRALIGLVLASMRKPVPNPRGWLV
jgi:uncharacterized membrane protein